MSRFDPSPILLPPEQGLQRLKKQAIAVALAHILGAFLLASLLFTFWPQPVVMIWTVVTTAALLHIWSLTWRNLGSHHPPGHEQLFPSLGPGNFLSLFRALLLACLAGFILAPWPPDVWAWIPALLYTFAGIIDYFDGYMARISGYVSPLGEFLDIELDALGMLIVVTVAIHLGHLPVWFLIIGLARYLFIFGLSWRQRHNQPVYPLSPSISRRVLAGLQMGFLSVVLWPITNLQLMTLTGVLFAVPFLVVFLRDWLVVSGSLDVASPRYQRWRQLTLQVLMQWAPLGVRLLGVLALLAVIWQGFSQFETMAAALTRFGFPAATWFLAFFLLLEVVGAPFLLLGIAGRAVALLLLFPVGLTMLALSSPPAYLITTLAATYIIIFGTGIYSLWKPEDRIFRQRAGER